MVDALEDAAVVKARAAPLEEAAFVAPAEEVAPGEEALQAVEAEDHKLKSTRQLNPTVSVQSLPIPC